MGNAMRWSKFYWDDWENDPGLVVCSWAAQAIWLRMLGLMHRSERVGYLLHNGRPMSMQTLAFFLRGQQDEIARAVDELETNGVFSRDADGVIFSRRILKDIEAMDEARENGKKGGNLALKAPPEGENPGPKGGVKGGVNPRVKGGVKGGVNPRVKGGVKGGVKLEAEAEAESFCEASYGVASPEAERSMPRARRDGPLVGPPSARSPQRHKTTPEPSLTATHRPPWPDLLEIARERCMWWPDELGPPPHAPGCLVPPELLRPDDGKGWTMYRKPGSAPRAA